MKKQELEIIHTLEDEEKPEEPETKEEPEDKETDSEETKEEKASTKKKPEKNEEEKPEEKPEEKEPEKPEDSEEQALEKVICEHLQTLKKDLIDKVKSLRKEDEPWEETLKRATAAKKLSDYTSEELVEFLSSVTDELKKKAKPKPKPGEKPKEEPKEMAKEFTRTLDKQAKKIDALQKKIETLESKPTKKTKEDLSESAKSDMYVTNRDGSISEW